MNPSPRRNTTTTHSGTPPRFPLPKRSLDSIGLRRHNPPPTPIYRPELRSRASSSSALAQRAGSMSFTTAVPESYIKLTRKPPKRKSVARSKKLTPSNDLPLSKRWAAAAANAFRPSRKVEEKPASAIQHRRTVRGAEMAPRGNRPRHSRPPSAMPPARKSSLHAGAKSKSRSVTIVNRNGPSEKPLPSPPRSEAPSTSTTQEQANGDSKRLTEVKEHPILRPSLSGKPEVSEKWPVLSSSKVTHEAESSKIADDKEPRITSKLNDPVTSIAVGDSVEQSAKPATPPKGAAGFSRPPMPVGWVVNKSKHETPSKGTEHNYAKEEKHESNSPAASSINASVARLQGPSNETKIPETPAAKDEDNVATLKPNPFRNRNRTVSSPASTSAHQNNCPKAFSFDFNTGRQIPNTPNNGRPKISDFDGKETPNNYTTPRSEHGASRIPRVSPKVPTPPTAGEVAGSPWSGLKSPNRRSSIPVPSRMLHGNDKPGSSSLSTMGSSMKVYGDFSPGGTDTIFEDKDLEEEHERLAAPSGEANNESNSENEHGKVSTAANVQASGYRTKHLSMANRRGPKLRISPEADNLILGNATPNHGEPSQSSSGKRAKRFSGSKRLSGDSIFGNLAPRYLLNSQSSASLHPSSSSPAEEKAARERNLKKARSADTAYASLPRNRMRSTTAPAKSAVPEQTRKVSTNPFYDDEPAAGSVPAPVMFNERYPVLNSTDMEPRYSEAQSSQGHKGSSPLAESSTLVDDNDVADSRSQSDRALVAPSPVHSNASVEKFIDKYGNDPSSNERALSPVIRHRGSSHRSLHHSSRHRSTEHGSHGKSKLSQVAPIDTLHPSESSETVQKHAIEVPRKKHRDTSSKRRSRSTVESSKVKSSSKGSVLSNFRGLFTKQKSESARAAAEANPGAKENGNASSTTTAKRKDLEKVKAANSGTLSTGSPAERSGSRRARGRSHSKYDENQLAAPSHDDGGDHSRQTSDGLTIGSHMEGSPALTSLRNVSSQCMDILDSARDERNLTRQDELFKIGKMLVESVNHSNNAERAMLKAVQAAKEAEVACAMAKENTMRMGQIARAWINSLGDYSHLH
ncbi:hypothetical protein AJ79_08160 [Helicocarpus griseus UAMH5409]|uniref:Uncharacterized protein n=1 Tax=Helicocarpus griseus UAMH5409 TaxID=1447875 RepID=A0A2B7WMQ5_9EURO|nr:hypothetical protein AJ79_08160 [Helicocarpus griseus UAMH5409]